MTLPRSVADVVSRHVLFEIESIDRMYPYVPQLVASRVLQPGPLAGAGQEPEL